MLLSTERKTAQPTWAGRCTRSQFGPVWRPRTGHEEVAQCLVAVHSLRRRHLQDSFLLMNPRSLDQPTFYSLVNRHDLVFANGVRCNTALNDFIFETLAWSLRTLSTSVEV